MLAANLKSFAVGLLVGGAVLGTLALLGGYKWGAGDLAEIKETLRVQEAKVITVEKVIKEVVHQDRIVYRDKVQVVKEKLPFIVERDVYKNVCLDDEGVAGFNTLMGR